MKYVKLYNKVITIFLALILTACQTTTSKQSIAPSELYNAILAAENGECHKASELAAKLVENIHDDKLILKAAHIYSICNQVEKAEYYYNSILTSPKSDKHNYTEALEGKGLMLLRKDQLPEAKNIFSEVLARDASRWRAINGMGVIYATENKLSEAIDYYEIARSLSNDHYSVINNLALSFAEKKDFKRAIDLLDKALLKVSTPLIEEKINLNKAIIYAMSGRVQEAELIAQKYVTSPALEEMKQFYEFLAKRR